MKVQNRRNHHCLLGGVIGENDSKKCDKQAKHGPLACGPVPSILNPLSRLLFLSFFMSNRSIKMSMFWTISFFTQLCVISSVNAQKIEYLFDVF